MSRKTEEIQKSISRLEQLQVRLSKGCDNPSELSLLSENLKSEIENLKLWVSMLYKYNGTSRSNAKVAASRENGKKGGRPPKFVTDLKRQKAALEALLEDLHTQEISSPFDEDVRIYDERQKAQSQLSDVEEKLSRLEKEEQ